MKRGIIIVCAVVVLLLPVFAGAAENPWEKKLPFKQATITYALSGMEKGQEALYIKDHGARTARYRDTSSSMLGMIMKNKTVEIKDPDWVYTFDLQEKTGTKSINPQKLMIEEYSKLSAAEQKQVRENAEKMGLAVIGGTQGSVEQNAREILGYSCDRVSMMGSTVYSIHETPIALLSEINMMGISMTSEATAVDTAAVEDSYFAFPDGIEPQPDPEADQMAGVMASQTIAMLKDPEQFKAGTEAMPGMPQQGQDGATPEEQQKMDEAMNVLKGLFGK